SLGSAGAPLDNENGFPIIIVDNLATDGSQRLRCSVIFAFLLASLSVNVTGILWPDAQVLFRVVWVIEPKTKPPTMLCEISLYLKVADWPLMAGLLVVIMVETLPPSQVPSTPVFTPPCSMNVTGSEPGVTDIVLTIAGSPL